MPHLFVLRDRVIVSAPIERCFLLSTSIEIVERELGMHPVAGRTQGLVKEGDTIRWQGWQLGLPQFHVSRIELFEPPTFFRDRMIAGRFRAFEHDHSLTMQPSGRVMLADELRFTMHWGWLGDLLGYCLLAPHIRKLMRRRFSLLKQIAESAEWRTYLPQPQ
jgi:ligand-binding SRPBCC domain-containing protein